MEQFMYCECGLVNGLHTTQLFNLTPNPVKENEVLGVQVHTWTATCTNCGKQHEEGGFLQEWKEEMGQAAK